MEATLRKTSALIGKDAKDLVKNPTMLICCLLPIAFTALYTQVVSDVPGEAAGAVSLYLQTLSLAMTAGMVGSMTILYAIAEEKEKHTLRTLMLANVSGAQTLASRAVVAFAAILVVDVACFLVMRAPLDALAPYLAFGLLGSVPIVMLSLLLGLAARDQMTAGVYSLPIILVALVPSFAMLNDTIADVAPWLPTGGMQELLQLAAAGNLLTADAVQPLMVTLAWIVVTAAVFALLYRRLSRDN